MADMQSPQHPLEVLPAMLNLVLLQTAKIFRDPECHNSKHAGLTKRRVTEFVTVANQRFHDALDEIEVEILHAKAVLERDMRLIRKKRMERDRANGLIANPSPPQATNETVQSDAVIENEAIPMDVDRNLGSPKLTTDPPINPADQNPKLDEAVDPGTMSQEDITTSKSMPQDSENSMGLAITMPPDDPSKSEELPTEVEKPGETMMQPEPPVEIPDGIDLDFESMFNDTDPNKIDDTLNFDFGLSTNAPMAQDILTDNSFNDVDMSNAETTNMPAATNEFESLLPGVENYLNADTDFSDIGVAPAPTTLTESSQVPVIETTEASAQVPGEQAIADASFDDSFFSLGDFDVNENGGDELGDGTLGDFEDFDWTT